MRRGGGEYVDEGDIRLEAVLPIMALPRRPAEEAEGDLGAISEVLAAERLGDERRRKTNEEAAAVIVKVGFDAGGIAEERDDTGEPGGGMAVVAGGGGGDVGEVEEGIHPFRRRERGGCRRGGEPPAERRRTPQEPSAPATHSAQRGSTAHREEQREGRPGDGRRGSSHRSGAAHFSIFLGAQREREKEASEALGLICASDTRATHSASTGCIERPAFSGEVETIPARSRRRRGVRLAGREPPRGLVEQSNERHHLGPQRRKTKKRHAGEQNAMACPRLSRLHGKTETLCLPACLLALSTVESAAVGAAAPRSLGNKIK